MIRFLLYLVFASARSTADRIAFGLGRIVLACLTPAYIAGFYSAYAIVEYGNGNTLLVVLHVFVVVLFAYLAAETDNEPIGEEVDDE